MKGLYIEYTDGTTELKENVIRLLKQHDPKTGGRRLKITLQGRRDYLMPIHYISLENVVTHELIE